MLRHIGDAIGAVGAVAGAVLGGGGANNEQGHAQGNDEPSSSNNAPPNPNAGVLNPTYVLTNSISEQLGMKNEAPQQKQSAEEDPRVEEEEEEEEDSGEEKQAPHPLFDTSADRMHYAPGRQQLILGHSTVDRLRLSVAENTTRSEETTEASGRGYSSGEESAPFLSSFETSIDGSVGAGVDPSSLSPITTANSTHIHRAYVASPNFELDERINRSNDENASGELENNEELEELTSVDGTGTSTSMPDVLGVGLGHNESSDIISSQTAEEEHFPAAEDNSMLTDSVADGDTTESVDVETDLETSMSTTRSGRNYASTSTIVRAKRKATQDQTHSSEATTKRRIASDQSQPVSILSADLTTPVFGVKAECTTNTKEFTVMFQLTPGGRFLEASDKDIITFRMMGHAKILEDVRQKALEKGEARASIQTGAKADPGNVQLVVKNPELNWLGPVKMTGTGKHCATDSITNMLHDAAPHLYTENLGTVLRSYCNKDGKIHMNSLCSQINGKTKATHGFQLQKIKMAGDEKPFMNSSPLLRQKKVFDLVSAGRMLIVDYHCKRNSKAIGHVVGVANGKVYDNDEATGGIFDLHAYAAREWDGVYMARIIVPH